MYVLDFSRTEVLGVDPDNSRACLCVIAFLVHARPTPSGSEVKTKIKAQNNSSALDGDPKDSKRLFDKFADGVRFTRGKDEIFGLGLLHHHPHALDVVLGCE